MPIRPSSLARAIECPASVWQVDDGMPQDPNKYQMACDRGTVIHEWWYSLTLGPEHHLPPPCPAKYQSVWLEEAERMDPGGLGEVHILLYDKDGQPVCYQGDVDEEDPPTPPGCRLIFRGTADRVGRGHDGHSPWCEDLKTGRRKVSPRSWQHQAYGLGFWILADRPAKGLWSSTLTWPRDLTKVGQADRKDSVLRVGDLYTAWQTILKVHERVALREPPNPNPECGLCPVAGSCPALQSAPF